MTEILDQLARHRLVPVIALEDAAQANPLAEALVRGGLPVAEVTFRTAAAVDSIRAMAARGDLLVGAGTVLTLAQADEARDAGATFIVSPGFNPKVVQHCLDQGLHRHRNGVGPRARSRQVFSRRSVWWFENVESDERAVWQRPLHADRRYLPMSTTIWLFPR